MSSFEKKFDQRQEAILDEVNINFLNINDLIEAQKNGSSQITDLADAEQLRKIRERKNKKSDALFLSGSIPNLKCNRQT